MVYTSLGTKIDPGFSDHMLLIFANDSDRSYKISYGKKICNVMFFEYDNPPANVKIRGRTSLLPFKDTPTNEISDSSEDATILKEFGFGPYQVIKYVRPQIEKNTKKLKKLEKFKKQVNYIILTMSVTVIAGVIVWLLTR